jgi:hypothetical protein
MTSLGEVRVQFRYGSGFRPEQAQLAIILITIKDFELNNVTNFLVHSGFHHNNQVSGLQKSTSLLANLLQLVIVFVEIFVGMLVIMHSPSKIIKKVPVDFELLHIGHSCFKGSLPQSSTVKTSNLQSIIHGSVFSQQKLTSFFHKCGHKPGSSSF